MNISIAQPPQAAAQPTPTDAPTPPKDGSADPQVHEAVPRDTVSLSSTAQSALRESSETAAQTAKEAQHGDVQAKHLLAKRAAAKDTAASPPIHVIA